MFWAADSPAGEIFDPSNPLTYVNYGVLGIVVFLFVFRKIITIGELNEAKAAHARELEKQEADHSRELANIVEAKNREISRLEDDKTRLINERNQAMASEAAAYQVVTDFNHMAGGLIEKLPTISPDPRTRRKPGGSGMQ
jgi:hypothetical protein